ncbi:LysR family transcriptional regulator [Microbacterium lacus]|uniref:LysR family transcriptional regulator n=1 Tax=Microbacterium lacus TaxID=415217 RepID=A0ABN2FYR1_9MICO
MNVSLRLLRAFVAVSQEGHVGRAAARLFISQPSLSQDIRRLEREIGVVLFDRGPRGLTPTPAGEALLRSVEGALAMFDQGVANAREIAASGRGTIRVAYSPSLANIFMPSLLSLLERVLTAADIEEHELDTGAVGPAISVGAYDVGFAHCPTSDPRLVVAHIADEPLCVAVATGHPLAGRPSVRLSELSGSSLLIWPRASAPDYYDMILDICSEADVGLRGVKESRRITPRTYLLDDQQTFSLLPRSAASLPRPEVTFLPIEESRWTLPLTLICRAGDNRRELDQIRISAEQVGRAISAW